MNGITFVLSLVGCLCSIGLWILKSESFSIPENCLMMLACVIIMLICEK